MMSLRKLDFHQQVICLAENCWLRHMHNTSESPDSYWLCSLFLAIQILGDNWWLKNFLYPIWDTTWVAFLVIRFTSCSIWQQLGSEPANCNFSFYIFYTTYFNLWSLRVIVKDFMFHYKKCKFKKKLKK